MNKHKTAILLSLILLLAGCTSAAYFTPLPLENNGQYYFEHSGKPAVLVIHGLSATPWEVLGLSAFLAEHNLTVLTPVLAGHGRRPIDLESMTWQDWYNNVNDSYTRLAKTAPKVFVVGVSTGGSLALKLAKEHALAGVVTIGAPVVLRNSNTKYAAAAQYILRYIDHPVIAAEEGHYYTLLPTNSIVELNKLIAATRADAPAVTEPVLLIQSTDDATVNPKSAELILNTLTNSTDKKILWLSKVRHTVIRDDTHAEALKEILKFVETH